MFKHLKSRRYYFKEILAFFFLLAAAYFFKQQKQEIEEAGKLLQEADATLILWGMLATLLLLLLHGLMYWYSFQAICEKLAFRACMRLFLKRNLISVFLPGGGVTSLAFFSDEVAKQGISKTKTAFASSIFAGIAFLSLAIVAIPVISFLAFKNGNSSSNWMALGSLVGTLLVLFWATQSFLKQGWVYRQLYRINPKIEAVLLEINQKSMAKGKLLLVLFCSTAIELLGMLHIGIAMLAIGLPINLEACIAGYVIATLFYAISPFLRGLGAVEVSLVLVLKSYGISDVDAFSITLLYRIFEFWMPLAFGILAFFSSRANIILRILPALSLAALGIVNMVSVLTPPMVDRLRFLKHYLPLEFIQFSNLSILGIGLMLLITAAFLIKGLKNAWRIAMALSLLSLVGHLTKGIDYEEAAFALLSIFTLWFTRHHYNLKSDPKTQSLGIQTAMLLFGIVMIYGVMGFYALEHQHFQKNYSWMEALFETLRAFFLMDTMQAPISSFAKWFVNSIHGLGVFSLCTLIYTLLKPYIFNLGEDAEESAMAKTLVEQYGQSADDYYKTYPDKSFYFSEQKNSFIAYKVSSGFAMALGEPVGRKEQLQDIETINGFEKFCLQHNIKPAYYKISEASLPLFIEMGKKYMPIGQEAIVDLQTFSLEGKDRKSLRNGLNALQKKGFFCRLYQPPLKDGLLQQLNFVSDEWLSSMNREEIVFSSGKFDQQELKQQQVITVENEDGKIVAFLTIIPDYKADEGTYDLIRRTKDAPAGVMDALIVQLIQQLKEAGKTHLNMGMASMSGIDKPKDLPEWTVKFAYEKLRQFRQHQGLYEFKDKFNPAWHKKYLVYQNHYDLITIPLVISKIMKE